MVTNRLYAWLFVAPWVGSLVLMALVSGFDLGFLAFAAGPITAAVGAVIVLSVPLIRYVNRWQRTALEALTREIGGEIRATVGGDCHLAVDDLVVFWVDTREGTGAPVRSWTCVGRRRRGPACELRLLPDGGRPVRWLARVWDGLRAPPVDPLGSADAHAAAEALAALSPGVESRIRFEGHHVAWAAPGRRLGASEVADLVRRAGDLVRCL